MFRSIAAQTAKPCSFMNYRGPFSFDDRSIGVIATEFGNRSSNAKTGHVKQTWILRENVSSIDPTQAREDAPICRAARTAGVSLMVTPERAHAMSRCSKRRQFSGRTWARCPSSRYHESHRRKLAEGIAQTRNAGQDSTPLASSSTIGAAWCRIERTIAAIRGPLA
jgi:hypothetical protein